MTSLVSWAALLLKKTGIARQDAEVLAALVASCSSESLTAGAVLTTEGDSGDSLWFLLEGAVEVRKRDYAGVDQGLAVVSAPSVLGHMSLVDGTKRCATCVASTDGLVAILERHRFEALLADDGEAGGVLRDLLIACMVDQLHRGMAQLRQVTEDAGEEPQQDAAARLSLILDGWLSEPTR
jgi:CRP-like cAMP-binding protein